MQGLGLSRRLRILDKLDVAHITLAKLDSVGGVEELKSEDLVTLFTLGQLFVEDLHHDFLLSLIVFEYELTFLLLEINGSSGGPLTLIDLNSLVANGDLTVRFVYPLDDNGALVESCGMAHIRVGEGNLAWLVVIKDGDSALGVAAAELVAGVQVVQLDQEILIGFPAIIVNNCDLDAIIFISMLEFDFFVHLVVVITGDGSVILGAHTDAAGMLVLVDDGDFGVADAFGN